MELTQTERLILWNQYEIRKHLNPKSAEHCEAAQEVLQRAYQPLYRHVLDRMEEDLFSEQKATFVYDVLDMYDALQRFEQTSDSKLEGPFTKFRGFDGHGDLVGFARFNVEVLNRWKFLNIDEFDAHMPIEPFYERMLAVWKRKGIPERFTLSQADVDEILSAA